MEFTPEVEYEVIRDAVLHKLDRPLINPPKEVWRDSTKNKTTTSPFQIGDSLRYKNDGHNEMVDLVDLHTNYTDSTKYRIKFLIGKTLIVTN